MSKKNNAVIRTNRGFVSRSNRGFVSRFSGPPRSLNAKVAVSTKGRCEHENNGVAKYSIYQSTEGEGRDRYLQYSVTALFSATALLLPGTCILLNRGITVGYRFLSNGVTAHRDLRRVGGGE